MDRRLLDYLPPVLREVLEFQVINEANEPEISLAWDALTLVLANQFLDTADHNGVSVWEKELCIFPKDTDTLEIRKARIKAMWNLELPYTLGWLKNWLTSICGPTGHEETVSDYTIHIQVDCESLLDIRSQSAEILEMLLAVRPSNMQVLMSLFLQSSGGITCGACCELGGSLDIWPLVPREIEVTGGVRFGACAMVEHSAKVFPMAARSIRTTGGAAGSGALVCQGMIEIFPMEE